MLQQTELVRLLERLKSVGFWIEVETNGTIVPEERLLGRDRPLERVPEAGELRESAFSEGEAGERYRLFSRLPSAHFKYVVDTPDDVAEVRPPVGQVRDPSAAG